MKTRKFLMVLVVVFMGSQMTLLAQEKKPARPERRQFTKEQMQDMQCNQLIRSLALDDATAAKFTPVYKEYMEEMCATRDMKPHRAVVADKEGLKQIPTDAEVEQAIKARFAQSRKMLDIREKYYNEFRKFLSPKQIQKMYNHEKRNGNKFRREMNKRQDIKRHHEGKKHIVRQKD